MMQGGLGYDVRANPHINSSREIHFHKLESLQASTGCELSRIFSSFSLPLLLFRV